MQAVTCRNVPGKHTGSEGRADGLVEYRTLADIEALERVDGEGCALREAVDPAEDDGRGESEAKTEADAVQVGALARP